MSQIWKVKSELATGMWILWSNSIAPVVCFYFLLKEFFTKRVIRLDFPTPTSPRMTILRIYIILSTIVNLISEFTICISTWLNVLIVKTSLSVHPPVCVKSKFTS